MSATKLEIVKTTLTLHTSNGPLWHLALFTLEWIGWFVFQVSQQPQSLTLSNSFVGAMQMLSSALVNVFQPDLFHPSERLWFYGLIHSLVAAFWYTVLFFSLKRCRSQHSCYKPCAIVGLDPIRLRFYFTLNKVISREDVVLRNSSAIDVLLGADRTLRDNEVFEVIVDERFRAPPSALHQLHTR